MRATRSGVSRYEAAGVALATVACLLPFAGKAFQYQAVIKLGIHINGDVSVRDRTGTFLGLTEYQNVILGQGFILQHHFTLFLVQGDFVAAEVFNCRFDCPEFLTQTFTQHR